MSWLRYAFSVLLLVLAGIAAAQPTPASLMELRRHTESAMARGDYRAAEMLIETYLPAAEKLADGTWHRFNGHLIACRIKLALDKLDEAGRHAEALRTLAGNARGDDAMEQAIAEITLALVHNRQQRWADAEAGARRALAILNRVHEHRRITRQTFENERLAYEDVLIEARNGGKSAPAARR